MDRVYNIFIVDDDTDIREGMQYALEKEGYSVSTGGSVKVCKKMLQQKVPDLLLLDVVLPDGDGISLAQELNGDDRFASMGILLMSGMKTQPSFKQKGLSHGALHYASKPIPIGDLLERIKLIFRVRELERKNTSLQDQYNIVFSNAYDIIIMLDQDGKVLKISQSYQSITGIDIGQQLHKPFETLLATEYKNDWQLQLSKLRQFGALPTFETYLINSFGNILPIEMQLTKSISVNDQSFVFLGIAKDMRILKMLEANNQDESEQTMDHQKREISSWEAMSSISTSLTAESYEVSVLQKTSTKAFEDMMNAYQQLIDKAIEQRIYKNKHDNKSEHRQYANELGFLKAGPRDLIRIHTQLFKSLDPKMNPKKMAVYHVEARLILLSIMGYLVSFYKNRNISSS